MIRFTCLQCNKVYNFENLRAMNSFRKTYHIVSEKGNKTRNAVCSTCYSDLFNRDGSIKSRTEVVALYVKSGGIEENFQAMDWDETEMDYKIIKGTIENVQLKAKVVRAFSPAQQVVTANLRGILYNRVINDLYEAGCSLQEIRDARNAGHPSLVDLIRTYL